MPLPNTFGAASARGFGAFSFQTPSDPNFSSVSLLLPGNGTNGAQNNTFLDSSANNFAITRNGNTTQGTFSPFPPAAGSAWSAATNGGSGYFDGSGDYLSVPSNAAFAFGTGAVTVEAFINTTTQVDFQSIIGSYDGSTGWFLHTSATGVVLAGCDASTYITGTENVCDGAWHHIALVRSGSTQTLYIDGVSDGSNSNSTNVVSTAEVRIGSLSAGFPRPFTGKIGSLRVVKGTAVYTSNFTPPTAPLTAITNTSLLLNFTNAGIYDAAAKNDLETVGNAQISTTQSKWGGSSMYFDGTGDYLLFPDSANINLGSGNFTVEAWAYPAASPNQPIIVGQWSGSTGSTTLSWALTLSNDANRNLRFLLSSSGSAVLADTVSSSALTFNAWSHIALVRNGDVFTAYLNGVAATGGTYTIAAGTALYDATNQLSAGGTSAGGQNFNGYLQDLRITKGVARYTSNFTPPTAPFPVR